MVASGFISKLYKLVYYKYSVLQESWERNIPGPAAELLFPARQLLIARKLIPDSHGFDRILLGMKKAHTLGRVGSLKIFPLTISPFSPPPPIRPSSFQPYSIFRFASFPICPPPFTWVSGIFSEVEKRPKPESAASCAELSKSQSLFHMKFFLYYRRLWIWKGS